jgi:hypothetical protein
VTVHGDFFALGQRGEMGEKGGGLATDKTRDRQRRAAFGVVCE